MTDFAANIKAAPWPYAELDPAALRAGGWRPTPVHDVILKVHQHCNLACDYCYMYEHVDQSWKDRPATMPDDVRRATLDRLAAHVTRHRLPGIRVILHGGEPLMLGPARLGALAADLRAAIPGTVEIGMQTNGVLLTERALAALAEHRIMIGVSVDGTPETHDRHRVNHAGRGSWGAVSRALRLLRKPEHRSGYAGLLCTIDPETDPVACYEGLLEFAPPAIDFLFPHATWGQPPHRPGGNPTAYGEWLAAVFDRWFAGDEPTGVRLFDDVIGLLLGAGSRSEQIGLSPAALVVIETDGAIEQVDALKTAYSGAAATGLDVRRHDLDLLFDDPGVVARQIGRAALAPECLACPVHRICGAGHYVHRYRPGAGFRNPSVYCEDLRLFIGHVHDRVQRSAHELKAATAS